MEQVRMKPLEDREKRKIQQDIQKNLKVKKLTRDPISICVPDQNYAVVSFISPWSQTQPSEFQDVDDFLKKRKFTKIARIQLMNMLHEKFKIMLKVRGCFRSLDEADSYSKNVIGPSEGIKTWSIPMYEYGVVPPNRSLTKKDEEGMNKSYEDEQANDFYRKRRVEQEVQKREFSRRMEIFREESKKNNDEYQALTDEERNELSKKRKKTESEIEGVPIEKILGDERMKKIINQDTFNVLRDVAPFLGVEHEQIFEGWAKMNAERKRKEIEKEEFRIEMVEKEKMESSSSSSSSSAVVKQIEDVVVEEVEEVVVEAKKPPKKKRKVVKKKKVVEGEEKKE